MGEYKGNYFLFGSEAVDQFNENENPDEVTTKEGAVFHYHNEYDMQPSFLLDAYSGWDKYVEIDEDQYEILFKHFNS